MEFLVHELVYAIGCTAQSFERILMRLVKLFAFIDATDAREVECDDFELVSGGHDSSVDQGYSRTSLELVDDDWIGAHIPTSPSDAI